MAKNRDLLNLLEDTHRGISSVYLCTVYCFYLLFDLSLELSVGHSEGSALSPKASRKLSKFTEVISQALATYDSTYIRYLYLYYASIVSRLTVPQLSRLFHYSIPIKGAPLLRATLSYYLGEAHCSKVGLCHQLQYLRDGMEVQCVDAPLFSALYWVVFLSCVHRYQMSCCAESSNQHISLSDYTLIKPFITKAEVHLEYTHLELWIQCIQVLACMDFRLSLLLTLHILPQLLENPSLCTHDTVYDTLVQVLCKGNLEDKPFLYAISFIVSYCTSRSDLGCLLGVSLSSSEYPIDQLLLFLKYKLQSMEISTESSVSTELLTYLSYFHLNFNTLEHPRCLMRVIEHIYFIDRKYLHTLLAFTSTLLTHTESVSAHFLKARAYLLFVTTGFEAVEFAPTVEVLSPRPEPLALLQLTPSAPMAHTIGVRTIVELEAHGFNHARKSLAIVLKSLTNCANQYAGNSEYGHLLSFVTTFHIDLSLVAGRSKHCRDLIVNVDKSKVYNACYLLSISKVVLISILGWKYIAVFAQSLR